MQVWPIANTVAFRYIPQDLRIIYQNVLGVAMVNAAGCMPYHHLKAVLIASWVLDWIRTVEVLACFPCRAPT
jgi:Mpv17 / PMP22 family